ncbi:hypothetical protein HK101_003676 [Irineochytrium annulatum]|nr:hypothetical protein HK101_003676 [Irineochytrium annulatum]
MGVFLDQINYVLVVATPVEIMLVAVAVGGESQSTLNLYKTEIILSSDTVSMVSIIGTEAGRIFMCGNDGRLYELQYQAEEGIFTRKCRKINLSSTVYDYFWPSSLFGSNEGHIRKICYDRHRRLLYTLSETNVIQMFFLGTKGTEFTHVCSISDTFAQAQRKFESGDGHAPQSAFLDPRTFRLVSLHPVDPADSKRVQLLAVSSSGFRLYFRVIKSRPMFADDITFDGSGEPSRLELERVRPPPGLWLTPPGASAGERAAMPMTHHVQSITLTEVFGTSGMEGKAWAICDQTVGKEDGKENSLCWSSDLAVVNRNRVVVLTNTDPSIGPNVIHWAKDLFFEVGGKPVRREDPQQMNMQGWNLESYSIDTISKGGDDFLGRPLSHQGIKLSGRHDGLAIYLARLLAPIWKKPITKKGSNPPSPNFSFELLGQIRDSLTACDEFVTHGGGVDMRQRDGFLESDAWQEEHMSIRSLHEIVKQSIEGISFVLLLMDLGFPRLFEAIRNDLPKYLRENSFESLITSDSGKEIGKKVFSHIIESKIDEGVEDPRQPFYDARKRCYDLVRSLIAASVDYYDSSAELPTETLRGRAVMEALSANDELYHIYVFDTYIENGWINELLEIDSPYLEGYLTADGKSEKKMQILWRYYLKREQVMNAAKVLYYISTSKDFEIQFKDRLQWLQLAVSNAMSTTLSLADADFLRELEDKRDIALVQMEVISAVAWLQEDAGEKVVPEDDPLFWSLLTISDLYLNYTKRFQLYETTLEIFHISEHKDLPLVQLLWNNIIQKALQSKGFPGVETKVKTLGTRFCTNENVFPLVGVTYGSLFQVYYNLFEAKIKPWDSVEATNVLIKKIHHLLKLWIEDLRANPKDIRSFPANAVDEAITRFLAGGVERDLRGPLQQLQEIVRKL